MNRPVLSLDIGASFTKIAYREGFVETELGEKRHDAKFFMEEKNKVLIPSMAIRTNNPDNPWIFGLDAAYMTPDESMDVYLNWKEHLYKTKNTRYTQLAGRILGEYLGWLRRRLEDVDINLENTVVRVAVPALKKAAGTAKIIAEIMELSGWGCPLILKATEPHANGIGLMSLGKNVGSRNNAGDFHLNYSRMLHGTAWLNAAQMAVLADNQNRTLRTLIIDIGSFTTDFALLTFDVLAEGDEMGDGLKNIQEKSLTIGIAKQFDRELFEALESRHGFDRSELNFIDGEELKRRIYMGEVYELTTDEGDSYLVGDETDQDSIRLQAEKFSDNLWAGLVQFLDGDEFGNTPNNVYLTGGGSLIEPINKNLKSKIMDAGMSFSSVPPPQENKVKNPWNLWSDSGEGMARLATAAGGCSVILEASGSAPEVVEEHGDEEATQPAARIPTDTVSCSCQGGNKDCCFCGGLGYRIRPAQSLM